MPRPLSRTLTEQLPGIVLAALVGWAAIAVHDRWSAVSPHVVAVLAGVVLANTVLSRWRGASARLRPGLRTSAKRILRAGIVLLGFRLSLRQLGQLGPRALLAVGLVVLATFVGTRWLCRRMGLHDGLGLLLATGYSICGASAIAAMEPFADASETDVAYSLALVTLCGSLSIGVLPALGHALALGDSRFGAWVGAAVHDVGQVVAAASTRNAVAIRTATVVKLTRVALLAPLLAVVAVRHRRADGTRSMGVAPLPLFIVLFLAAVALRSTGWLNTRQLADIQWWETMLLAVGLFGLGTGVDLAKLRAVGGRPLVAGLISWALVAAVSLAAVSLAGT